MRWLIVLLLVAPAAAQDDVGLILLVHHPYPDQADPLGFEFQDGLGYYERNYRHFDDDRNGFDFPHAVFDGILPVEGIPDNAAPFASIRAAYQEGFERRAETSSPFTLQLSDDHVAIEGEVPGESDLQVWVAAVEDHVMFEQDGRVSNGVTDHRFTVRAVQTLGPVAASHGVPWQLDDGHYLVAWIQQSGEAGRFDAHEIVQAGIHRIGDAPSTQSTKGVLMQLYSATWCDPCLFGDLAAEELVLEHGVQTESVAPASTYWQAPPMWVFIAALAVAAAAFLVRLPGERR